MQLLNRLAESDAVSGQGRTCALFGAGSQTRALHRELASTPGLEVVWHADFGPCWLRLLGPFMAAHGGLVRILDASVLPETVRALANLAMVELFSFDSEHWPGVKEHVRAERWQSRVDTVLASEDPSYFCMGIDGDPMDSQAYAVWTRIGTECAETLRRVANLGNEA